MHIDIEFNSGAQLPLDAIPELARLAETHGFGCVWGGEANNKDPTVMLRAVAAVTERNQIGSAVYHILGRTPATLALQAIGLSELSRGRFLLGVGVSNPTIARWHGLVMDHPLGRAQEYTADNHAYKFCPEGAQGLRVLAAGKYLYPIVDFDDIAERAHTDVGFFVLLVNLLSSHPVNTFRFAALADRSTPGRIL
jgi:alkanesulfonate monooxygenase SsuD/methylene tetrahydromethanopterin reductase-like flavin-dependent oxidoreductase (luciferase family)